MPSRAVPVSQRAQGERQSHRRAAAAPDDVCEVCDVEQVDWKRKYEDVVAELGRVRTQRQVARKKVGELAAKLEEYESAATPPALSSKQTLSRHARKFAKQLQAYAASDRAKLMVAALHAASKGTGKDLREDVLLTTSFKKLRRALKRKSDWVVGVGAVPLHLTQSRALVGYMFGLCMRGAANVININITTGGSAPPRVAPRQPNPRIPSTFSLGEKFNKNVKTK